MALRQTCPAGTRDARSRMLTAMCALLLVARSSTGQQCGTALGNIDFNGLDVQPPCSAHTRTADDCCKQCSSVPACRAFTWIAGGVEGLCCLKTSPAGRRTVVGHVSGCLLTSAADANCSNTPPAPAPAPPPAPPPPPPAIPWGVPPLPSWPAVYNMSLSTAIEPCNYSGLFDLDFASKFGYVDWDWSNGKAVWANQAPMTCEETLIQAAEQTHKRNPAGKVFIYRNLVKALNWFDTIRDKLDDPAFAGFFLKFNSTSALHVPRCDNRTTPPKCSNLYHDQLQTPQWNGTVDVHSLNDGNCTVGHCDCGKNPCGEYLFDHRNGSMLRKWIVDEVIGGPNGVDNPAVAGVNIDDYWGWNGHPGVGANGPSEEDSHAVQDCGLSPSDVHDMHDGWQRTVFAVKESLMRKGKFQAEWFNCPYTPNASDYCWAHDATGRDPRTASLATCDMDCQKAACTQYMRAHCKPSDESMLHKMAWMYLFTKDASTNNYVDADGKLPLLMQDLARFLILRGPYAWIGYSWSMCGFHYARPPQLDTDYGHPTGDCIELGNTGVFRRNWSKAEVSLDCRSFEGKIEMH